MVKKFLAAVVVLLVMVSGAWADWMLFGNQSSIADMTNGKSDYSYARFFRFSIELQEPDIQATEEYEKISGTLTISGGNYSFWNGTKMQKVSNTPQTFRLEEVGGGNNSLRFVAKDNAGNIVYLLPDNETGLNGVNVSCDFPEMPSLNGQVNLGNFRTVQEQVNEFVPYVEYIRDGSKVTGLICRAVKGSDTSSAVSADSFGMNAWVNIWGQSWNWICSYGLENGKPNNWFDAGEAIEGTISFDEPVEESDIWAAEIWFCTFENGQRKDYDWYFFDNKPVPNIYLWRPHASRAELINGKSDYRNAEFVKVDMYIEAENILAEAKHLTDEGRINIPGGGYTIVSDDDVHSFSSKTVLGTVESGNNKTFGLRMRNGGLNASNAYIGTTWAEYEVTDDSGRSIAFAGGAETGLNGRTVTWTFPADLGFDGNNTFPDFKSTAEQLAGILPYAEIVSADGKVTAINYRLVTSNDTSTVQTPSYRTDFRIYIESWDEEAQQAVRLYRGSWQNDKTSGTIELSDENIPVSQVSNVQVRLRSREDSRRPVYIWHFLTAEAPAPLEITTATLPSAVVNASYTATLTANIPGATWTVSSGTLPAGLTLNPTTGTISGTPTTANDYTFTVRATSGTQSAEKSFTVSVSQTPPATITITTNSLNPGTVDSSYSETLTASTAGATWSVISGTLPSGLTLNPATGAITGTPKVANTYKFTVRAVLGSATAQKQFTVIINTPVTPLAITTSSLPEGTYSQPYAATLAANISPVTWSVSSGDLPAGFTLDSSKGEISGTPTAAGTTNFTMRAEADTQSAEKQFSITINPAQGTESGSSGGCNGLGVMAALALAFIISKKR